LLLLLYLQIMWFWSCDWCTDPSPPPSLLAALGLSPDMAFSNTPRAQALRSSNATLAERCSRLQLDVERLRTELAQAQKREHHAKRQWGQLREQRQQQQQQQQQQQYANANPDLGVGKEHTPRQLDDTETNEVGHGAAPAHTLASTLWSTDTSTPTAPQHLRSRSRSPPTTAARAAQRSRPGRGTKAGTAHAGGVSTLAGGDAFMHGDVAQTVRREPHDASPRHVLARYGPVAHVPSHVTAALSSSDSEEDAAGVGTGGGADTCTDTDTDTDTDTNTKAPGASPADHHRQPQQPRRQRRQRHDHRRDDPRRRKPARHSHDCGTVCSELQAVLQLVTKQLPHPLGVEHGARSTDVDGGGVRSSQGRQGGADTDGGVSSARVTPSRCACCCGEVAGRIARVRNVVTSFVSHHDQVVSKLRQLYVGMHRDGCFFLPASNCIP